MSTPQRFINADDEAAKELLRRLLLEQAQQTPRRLPANPESPPVQFVNPYPVQPDDPSGDVKTLLGMEAPPLRMTRTSRVMREPTIRPTLMRKTATLHREPAPFVPGPSTSTDAATKVKRLMAVASEPGWEFGRPLLNDHEGLRFLRSPEPPAAPAPVAPVASDAPRRLIDPKSIVGANAWDERLPDGRSAMNLGWERPGPIRIPRVEEGAAEPVMPPRASPFDASGRWNAEASAAVTDQPNRTMEQVAKDMPTPDYSNAHMRPELGIDYYNRTGKRRPEGETPAGVWTGVGYKNRNPTLPDVSPIRIPTLSDAAISDSTVQMPMATDTAPQRMLKDPAARDVPRQEGESDAAYAARKHRAFREAQRTESPDSKVKETPTGVTVEPPMKRRGFKGRGLAGLLLALGNMKGSTPAAAAGSAIVNFLTGSAAPDFERKIERGYQIQGADAQSKTLDEQEQRDLLGAERRARTEELNDYPRRKADEEKDKRWGRREQQMRLLAASPAGFDPQNNAEHKRLQLEAMADGQMLPAIPPKAGRATNQTPHTSTRSVLAGEYQGLKPGTKIRQIWNGTEFEDDLQNGKPVISAEAPAKPQTPDIRGDLQSQINSLQVSIAASETEWNRHNSNIQTKDRWIQTEAARRQKAAQQADPTGLANPVESKRSLKEWIDILRAEDADIAGGGYDIDVTSRKFLEDELTGKKAQLKELHRQFEQEQRRPRQLPGTGRIYTTDQLKAWAKARGITVAQARARLENEGATIQ